MLNGNRIGEIICAIFAILSFVIIVGIFIRFINERLSPVKKANAILVDKQKYTERVILKNGASHDETKCVITFLVNNKRIHFCVSEFSYDGYSLNQKGILRYKGGKILEFKA